MFVQYTGYAVFMSARAVSLGTTFLLQCGAQNESALALREENPNLDIVARQLTAWKDSL